MARPITGPDHVLFYSCGFELLSLRACDRQ